MADGGNVQEGSSFVGRAIRAVTAFIEGVIE